VPLQVQVDEGGEPPIEVLTPAIRNLSQEEQELRVVDQMRNHVLRGFQRIQKLDTIAMMQQEMTQEELDDIIIQIDFPARYKIPASKRTIVDPNKQSDVNFFYHILYLAQHHPRNALMLVESTVGFNPVPDFQLNNVAQVVKNRLGVAKLYTFQIPHQLRDNDYVTIPANDVPYYYVPISAGSLQVWADEKGINISNHITPG
jgi:hypothetical protein